MSLRTLLASTPLLALTLVACGSGSGGPGDTGDDDSGPHAEAGADASKPEASQSVDASHPDSSLGDSGSGADSTTPGDSGSGGDDSSTADGGSDASTSDAGGDSSVTQDAGSGDASDGADTNDSSTAVDSSTSTDAGASDAGDGGIAVQGPCSPGAAQCGPGNIVEVCNSSGSAWLYSSSCSDTCSGGECTGTCVPGSVRCNGASVETCNAAGTAYALTVSCSTTCSPINSACTLATTELTAGNTNMDGVVVIDGDLTVDNLATLTSPTGNLTIYANTVTVQQGGSIIIAPTGLSALGQAELGYSYDGFTGNLYIYGGGGGGYGTAGAPGIAAPSEVAPAGYDGPGAAFGAQPDVLVYPGGAGGGLLLGGNAHGGLGGGVLQIIADSINVAGIIAAPGASGGATMGYGGGAGGGVLLAAPSVTVTGTISTRGGTGAATAFSSSNVGTCACNGPTNTCCGAGGDGGEGRIKLLSSGSTLGGTLTGVTLEGLLPPITVTSTSHPAPSLTYNDGFTSFDFSWARPFAGVQGYYVSATAGESLPAPGAGQFVSTEHASISGVTIPSASNTAFYLQVVPVGSTSAVGTVESYLVAHVNSLPPTLASATNPGTSTWLTGGAPYVSWTFPVSDASLSGAYYVLDHEANTIPDASSSRLSPSQKALQLSNVADGIWFFHLITQDTRGNFTKAAAHYQLNLGANPGTGSLVGQVVDASSKPVAGATVSLNGGVYVTTTDGIGDYSFTSLPAETWQATASAPGVGTVTATEVVTSGATTTANLRL